MNTAIITSMPVQPSRLTGKSRLKYRGWFLLNITGSLLLTVGQSNAQNLPIATNLPPPTGTNAFSVVSTNVVPLTDNVKYQIALRDDRALGERAVLPPGLKEKMKLTIAQRADLKLIEEEFMVTCLQYQAENKGRIDAAQESMRRARTSENPAEIQMARKSLQGVWVGLQHERARAVVKARPLFTPEQIKLLDDPANQWREDHAEQANDPSAN